MNTGRIKKLVAVVLAGVVGFLSVMRGAVAEFAENAELYEERINALIADEIGYAHRKHADRFEGVARFNAAKEATSLLIFFNEVWRNSAPDPDLRRIYL